MASAVIIGNKTKRELVLALEYSGDGGRIRSLSLAYRTLGVMAALLALSFAVFVIVLLSPAGESDALEDPLAQLDAQEAEFYREFRSLIQSSEELLERQRWIRRRLAGQHRLPDLENLEQRHHTLQAVHAVADYEKDFVPLLFLMRRLESERLVLSGNQNFAAFYYNHLNGLPHRKPVRMNRLRISSGFGMRRKPRIGYSGPYEFHHGLDLVADRGTPVLAAARGRVIRARLSPYGYGNHVVVDHPRGFQTLYAHLSKISVRHGQYLRAGALIGLVGSTGNSTGPHLHFEIRRDGTALNPDKYIATK